MGLQIKLFLLLMITALPIGKSDKEYEVINFRIPQEVWRQAFDPTPVLKSTVTVTVPVNVQDDSENELEDVEVQTPVPVLESPEVGDQNVTQDTPVVTQDTPVVSSTPAATQNPVQDEVVSDTPAEGATGQVTRFPCACRSRQCGCCTGAILERYRMKACGNITFVPEDFVFDVRMSINNNTMIRRRVSASDPPPICFNPRRAPFVRVCAEISNIRIRNRNAHACMDINADIAGFPIYTASFRCFSMGASGVKTGLKPKPPSSGPKPVNLFGGNKNDDESGGGGGFLENVASGIFGGEGGGGGGSSSDEDEGPFSAIGDAIGDFFDGDS